MLETRIDALDLSVLNDCQLPVRLAYVPGLLAFREVTVMQATLDGPVPRPTWRCMT